MVGNLRRRERIFPFYLSVGSGAVTVSVQPRQLLRLVHGWPWFYLKEKHVWTQEGVCGTELSPWRLC